MCYTGRSLDHPRPHDMTPILYRTDRVYGAAPQVLNIRVPAIAPDADPFATIAVTFDDRARNIAGTVTLYVIESDAAYVGAAVLREYDAGRYQ